MDIRPITDSLSVSPQITVEDVPEIKAQGFRSILCNRPDGEGGPDQPAFADLEAAAQAAGLEIAYQPVVTSAMQDSDADEFANQLAHLPKPVLAFCRSGTRCTMLWSLSQAGETPLEDILTAAGKAGYDMAGLAPRLAARGAK